MLQHFLKYNPNINLLEIVIKFFFFLSGFPVAPARDLPIRSLKHIILPFFYRYFLEEPKRDILLLSNLKHLEQLELIVERSYILKSDRNDHPWPSPFLQELIRELHELSENRINIITTMRQRNLFQECDCVWEGD